MTDKRREQIAFPNQGTTYYTEPRPAQKIPTREQILNAARRQAAYEAALQESDPSYSGHNAGIHPESRPYITDERNPRTKATASIPVVADDYELEEDEEYYVTRPHTSTRRYQVSPEHVYQSGKQRLHVRYVDVPKRSSQQNQLPPKRQRYSDEVETSVPTSKVRKRSAHPLLYLGVGMIAMLALVVLVFSSWNWIHIEKDDLTYGRPRTFQIDFVVGHNDSAANPSHFVAMNLNRHVQVIEIPDQDTTKERTFFITTLFGDGQDLTVRRVGAC